MMFHRRGTIHRRFNAGCGPVGCRTCRRDMPSSTPRSTYAETPRA